MLLKDQHGKFVYSDGEDFEQQMKEIAQQYPGIASSDFIEGNSDFATNITYSPVRHNLVSWYPFKKDADILEVGAGMGGITGTLCSVGKTVTSIEMSETRAEVIRIRFRGINNLTVISENVTRWKTQKRFEYIVVVGVLEYAASFDTRGDVWETYVAFLQALYALLKPGGVVLLAIENRFGLKYWVGGSEDHLLTPFAGIAGYQAAHNARTFTKEELRRLFGDAGFNGQRFYYVLPDYKFPTAVFTDEVLPKPEDLHGIHFAYPANSRLVARETDLYGPVLRNGMFAQMANSYLIEAVKQDLPEPHVVRACGSGEHRDEYRTVTSLSSDGTLGIKAADMRAKAHVQGGQVIEAALKSRGIHILEGQYANGTMTASCPKNPLASALFARAAANGDWDTCKVLLDELILALQRSADVVEASSPRVLECAKRTGIDMAPYLGAAYMDLNLSHAFWDGADLVFFGQQWCFEGLPLRFVLYDGLQALCGDNSREYRIGIQDIWQYVGIGKAEAAAYAALRPEVWDSVYKRSGDIYGGGGNCNVYSEKLTWVYKWREQEVQVAKAQDELGDMRQRFAQLEAEHLALNTAYQNVIDSKTWRLLGFWRRLRGGK